MKTAALFVAALVAAPLLIQPAAAQQVPNIVGTWTGASDGVGKRDGWVSLPVTLMVSEQRGRSFRAKVVYATARGEQTEDVVGTFAPDGKGVYLAGNDGIHIASLNGTTLDICYLEPSDDDALAVCASLQKKP